MTAETTETQATNPLPKRRYMSPAKKRQLIHELALGDLRYRQIAAKHSISYQYVKELAVEHAEEINELREMAIEKQRELWVMDPYNRALERMTDIDDLNHEMAKLKAAAYAFAASMDDGMEAAVPEQWAKLLELKHKLLKQLEESSGQLPTRTPAAAPNAGKASIEIVGVDFDEVAREWERGSVEPPMEVPK